MKKVGPSAHLPSSTTNVAGPDAGPRVHLDHSLIIAPDLFQVLVQGEYREELSRASGLIGKAWA